MGVSDLDGFRKATQVVSAEQKFGFLGVLARISDGAPDLGHLRVLANTKGNLDITTYGELTETTRDRLYGAGAVDHDGMLLPYAKEIAKKCISMDHTGQCGLNFEPYRAVIERFAPGSMPPLEDTASKVVPLGARKRTVTTP